MSEAKHTPGPWTQSGRHVYAEIDDGDKVFPEGVLIASAKSFCKYVSSCTRGFDPDTGRANARLIAAAPDLLAACAAYLDGIDSGNEPPGHIAAVHRAMRAAIAKATGKEPADA